MIKELIENAGGKVEEVGLLPDGSGFAIGSFPLPKDHWLTANPEAFNVPPMPFRMGKGEPERRRYEQALRAAGRYAVRCATYNGKEMDFDPDALIQNLITGFLGYHTATGLSSDEWANPSPAPTYQGQLSANDLATRLEGMAKRASQGLYTMGDIEYLLGNMAKQLKGGIDARPTLNSFCDCGHELWHHMGSTDPEEHDDESCGRINCTCQQFTVNGQALKQENYP